MHWAYMHFIYKPVALAYQVASFGLEDALADRDGLGPTPHGQVRGEAVEKGGIVAAAPQHRRLLTKMAL